MVRRGAGAVLLLTVVLAAMIVSRWLGPGLPGRAEAGPPPAPPVVGDCLQERVPTVDDTGAQLQRPRYAGCDGARAGEVVALGPIDDTLCTERVNGYLGLGADGGYLGGGPVWSPPKGFGAVLMGPSADQRLDGQDWSACAVIATAPGLVPTYPGPVRNLYRDAVPMPAGGCAGTTFPLEAFLPCADPHRVEWFGLTEQVAAGADLDRIRKECLTVLRTQLGTDDPTRDGLLTVAVPTYVLDEEGRVQLWWSSDRAAGASCGLQPTDRNASLIGTLRGLGEGAVPIVGT